MRFVLTILLCLISLSSACAQAGEWKKVLDNYEVKVFSDSIKSSKNKNGSKSVEFWATWDMENPVEHKNGKVKSIKVLTTISCDSRMYTLVGAGFPGPGMRGEKIFDDEPVAYNQIIEPETMFYELHAKYCASWWKVW